jgi:hypothetical protein
MLHWTLIEGTKLHLHLALLQMTVLQSTALCTTGVLVLCMQQTGHYRLLH